MLYVGGHFFHQILYYKDFLKCAIARALLSGIGKQYKLRSLRHGEMPFGNRGAHWTQITARRWRLTVVLTK